MIALDAGVENRDRGAGAARAQRARLGGVNQRAGVGKRGRHRNNFLQLGDLAIHDQLLELRRRELEHDQRRVRNCCHVLGAGGEHPGRHALARTAQLRRLADFLCWLVDGAAAVPPATSARSREPCDRARLSARAGR